MKSEFIVLQIRCKALRVNCTACNTLDVIFMQKFIDEACEYVSDIREASPITQTGDVDADTIHELQMHTELVI